MRNYALFALVAGSTIFHLYQAYREEKQHRGEEPQSEQQRPTFQPREDLGRGYDVWTDSSGIRMRGSFQDIMSALNPNAYPSPPPLPENLDIAGLPKYRGGCPHCNETSMYGENQWRYHELERSRGYMDNTTTYLAKCKKCQGFMRVTVDHDD